MQATDPAPVDSAETVDLAVVRRDVLAIAPDAMPDEALRQLAVQELVARSGPPGSSRIALRSLIESARAEAHRAAGRPREAFEHGLEADRLANSCGDPHARARAALALAHVHSVIGHDSEARRRLAQLADIPDVPRVEAVHAQMNLAALLRAEGSLEQAAQAFAKLQTELDAVPDELAASVLINSASCDHQLGRTRQAHQALARAAGRLDADARPDLWTWIDTIAAWVAAEEQDPAETLARATAVLAAGRSGANAGVRNSAARALARAALKTDDIALRKHALEACLGALEDTGQEHARRRAIDLHHTLAALYEADDQLALAVHHMREERRLEGELAAARRGLRMEREGLKLELVRLQVEADTLRRHQGRLEQANAALIAADTARTRLMRTLAHDLRGPMTNLMVLVDMVDPEDPDQVRHAFADVEASTRRLVALLDQALEPAAVTAGSLVELVELVHRSVRSFRALATAKAQRIEIEAPQAAMVRADPVRLGRMIDNLLSNALKYGPEDGAITVVVAVREQQVDVTVLDRGPGFRGLQPTDGLMLGHQLAARATGGEASWGLGLHTVYQVLAELGGILAIGTREGGGAAVRVTLPLG